MKKRKHTKHQHYVLRFYLNNFAKNGKVFVFNKYDNNFCWKNTREVCFENDLYETKWKNANSELGRYVADNKIELLLSKIEDEAKEVINYIICTANICDCVKFDLIKKRIFLEFVSTLYLRHPNTMRMIKDYYSDMDEDEEVYTLYNSVEKLFSEFGWGSSESLINHNLKLLPFEHKNMNGSPFNVIYESLMNMNLVFLKTNKEKFITSSFPLLVEANNPRVADKILIPLNSNIACVFINKKYGNLKEGAVINVFDIQAIAINKLFLNGYDNDLVSVFISNDEETLRKLIRN